MYGLSNTTVRAIARRLAGNPRLTTVPPAVVEDILSLAFEELDTLTLDQSLSVHEIMSDEVRQCESCDKLVPRSSAKMDLEDGISFCAECAINMKDENI